MPMEEGRRISRRVPIESCATAEEVCSAFYGLKDEEQIALERYAEWRIVRVGIAASGRTPDDLLQEAFESTFDTSRRHWNKDKVSFFNFVKGIIRSTSSNWAAKNKRQQIRLTTGATVYQHEFGEAYQRADDATDEPDISSLAENIKSELEELVAGHRVRREVLAGWKSGMSGPRIQERCGITKREYDAARQWIYRQRKRLAIEVQRHE